MNSKTDILNDSVGANRKILVLTPGGNARWHFFFDKQLNNMWDVMCPLK